MAGIVPIGLLDIGSVDANLSCKAHPTKNKKYYQDRFEVIVQHKVFGLVSHHLKQFALGSSRGKAAVQKYRLCWPDANDMARRTVRYVLAIFRTDSIPRYSDSFEQLNQFQFAGGAAYGSCFRKVWIKSECCCDNSRYGDSQPNPCE